MDNLTKLVLQDAKKLEKYILSKMSKKLKDKSVKISNWHKDVVAKVAKEKRQSEKTVLELAIENTYMPPTNNSYEKV